MHTAPDAGAPVGDVSMPPCAAWASNPARGRGRRRPEAEDALRNAYQRDRDRIVHSTAFRRLVYKTQVFLNHEGDLFRTRLTHSLEVAQVGRSIARGLGLHEDLVEAISLAHDLGHTPFGHAGQDALNHALRELDPQGQGFEHNLQSLRVVDHLEQQYPDFDGLNLTFETREGILKHCSRANARRLEEAEPGGVGRRFLDATRPSLEAQLCNLADEIAYNAHDIDDGLRSGLLDIDALREVGLFDRFHAAVQRDFPALSGRRLVFEITRRILSTQIHDVIATTGQALRDAAPASADEVRRLPVLVRFSPAMAAEVVEIKRFLGERLYRHPQVLSTTEQARQIVAVLFAAYTSDPASLPEGFDGDRRSVRSIADYLAGMTDRLASREYRRITGRRPFD
ncbi:deoxyguanosinetriphosphate triphosphohydrolase [Piscinibacter sakaiensis]|uniref:deoxyguanosinetriphosphate triphosphohydrolase n=1 Tax=Piscinibacter sakaiensis TaxID=1547922 RepID=UPI003AADFE45